MKNKIKNLAAVLYRIKQEDKYNLKEISRKLQTFLPNFIEVDVIDDNENKQYLIKLKDKDKKEYSSRVLSEGTLRILALCILEYDNKHTGLLCFEEPENGIHPFRIEAMTKLLKDLSIDFIDTKMPLRQVIVNTHSPVLVGHINKWEQDKNVSIWYAEIITSVITVSEIRRVLAKTSMIPVIKTDTVQLSMAFSLMFSSEAFCLIMKTDCIGLPFRMPMMTSLMSFSVFFCSIRWGLVVY